MLSIVFDHTREVAQDGYEETDFAGDEYEDES